MSKPPCRGMVINDSSLAANKVAREFEFEALRQAVWITRILRQVQRNSPPTARVPRGPKDSEELAVEVS